MSTAKWLIGGLAAMLFLMLLAMGGIGVYMFLTWQPPDSPPSPTPSPTAGLAELVPDPDHRADLKLFFSDFAAVVRTGNIKTTDDFRQAYRVAVTTINDAGRIRGAQLIDEPINKRFVDSIGLDSRVLTPADINKLATTLDGIAAEF